jgi:hypothetical protein
LPERNDRDHPRFENLEPRRSDGYRATGGAWAWWWGWFIILVCAFVWFGGWGWGSYGGWWWGNHRFAGRYSKVNVGGYNGPVGTPVGDGQSPQAAVLIASNKREFEGQSLQVSGASVTKRVNNDVFWVGSNSSAPLLVVISAPANPASARNVTAGESVNVSGTIEKAPPADEAKKDWGLDDAGTQRLEKEGAYLNATDASRAQR